MNKLVTEAVVNGFGSGETDFLTRLNEADEETQDQFETQIIQPILAVLDTEAETAVLTITGHADRVDTPGLSHEERRKQELAASEQRTLSAVDGVRQIIDSRVIWTVPDDLNELIQLHVADRPSGAAVLREDSEPLPEDQRLLNRRVNFRLIRFQLD
jgi:methyl coenzyme M reductase gamma subunit